MLRKLLEGKKHWIIGTRCENALKGLSTAASGLINPAVSQSHCVSFRIHIQRETENCIDPKIDSTTWIFSSVILNTCQDSFAVRAA